MDGKHIKLDTAKIDELKKHAKPLDKEMISHVSGGRDITSCPWCGGELRATKHLIEGGPDAGEIEIFVYCLSCDYQDWWGYEDGNSPW